MPHASLVRLVTFSADHHLAHGIWGCPESRISSPARLERPRVFQSETLAAEVRRE